MATSVIGLDIGSSAVRAAELNVQGGKATLVRFGQISLPPDAVRDGEVADTAAVTDALKRLWAQVGFKGRTVRMGVANQRVIVREADVTAMSAADFRTALSFEAEELIPIPVDEAILDFRIVGPAEPGPDDEPRMRITLAAASREMIAGHIAAAEAAGLRVDGVEATPFALVRALATRDEAPSEGSPSGEAIVCIGGDVTNIVVHQAGVPRFVRVLPVGGQDLTNALARELRLEYEEAEALKRRAVAAGGDGDQLTVQATRVMRDRLAPLVDEIRGSLDYYLSQPGATPIRRVVLSGGGTRMVGLMERVEHQLRLDVSPGRPLSLVKVADLGLSPDQLGGSEPLLAVALGLALPDYAPLDGEHRISLIPAEIAAGLARKRQMTMVGAGVLAFTAALGLLWGVRQAQVVSERARANEAEQTAAKHQQQLTKLADMVKLRNDLGSSRRSAENVLKGDVDFPRLLEEISAGMPPDVSLSGFTAQRAEGGNTRNGLGQVNFNASGQNHTSAALWLQQIGRIPSLSNLWVPTSTDSSTGGQQFASTATLTPAAHSTRADRYSERKQS